MSGANATAVKGEAPGTVVELAAMPVELADGKPNVEFTVQMKDPGIVRSVGWTLKKRLVMTAGQAQFDEVLSMFIEFTPNGPVRNRRFLVIPTSVPVNVPDGHKLVYLGTAISQNTGKVAHCYEVKAVS